MRPAIKFCGLTRPADAREAAALGAAYVGVIFAPSPRRRTLEEALALFEAADQQARSDDGVRAGGVAADDAADDHAADDHGAGENAIDERAAGGARLTGAQLEARRRPQRVGVFAAIDVPEIARMASALSLDVIQLHDTGEVSRIDVLRAATACRIWSVLHVGEAGIEEAQLAAAALADAVLLDAKMDGLLGGTGRTFDWAAVRAQLAPLHDQRPVILAGGLRPENVARAIEVFAPDVVDVSSGVEVSPGIKDPARMRAFADAVHGVALA